jgi:DNA-binding XRE family transcriptional regulator
MSTRLGAAALAGKASRIMQQRTNADSTQRLRLLQRDIAHVCPRVERESMPSPVEIATCMNYIGGLLQAQLKKHHRVLPFCYFSLRVGSERLAELTLLTKGRVPLPKTLGEHLRNRRLELGLRQQDVAENLGTLREVYDRWERGDRNPVISEWRAILGFLGYYPFPKNGRQTLSSELFEFKAPPRRGWQKCSE